MRDSNLLSCDMCSCSYVYPFFLSPYNPLKWNVVPRDRRHAGLTYWEHLPGTGLILAIYFCHKEFTDHSPDSFINIGSNRSNSGVNSRIRRKVDTILMSINDSFVVMPLLPILILIASVMRELNDGNFRTDTEFIRMGLDARVIRSRY